MTSMMPTETERNILEFMCDPERPKQLLETIKRAEAAEAKAIAAKAEAETSMKKATDTLTEAREVQDINTKKSAKLRDDAQALADQVEAAKVAKADDVARLTDWEQRLKEADALAQARDDLFAKAKAELDQQVADLDERIRYSSEIISRAERIKAAAES